VLLLSRLAEPFRALAITLLLAACAGPTSRSGPSSESPAAPASRPRDVAQGKAFFDQGLALEEQGRRREAVEAFAQASAADGEHGLAYLHEAENRLILEEDPIAVQPILKRAVELLETNPRVHLLLADALSVSGDGAGAEAHWKRAIELQPALVEARFHLALELERRGKVDEAVVQLTEAAKAAPGNVPVRVTLANLLAHSGKHHDAAKEMEAVAVLAASSAPLYRRAADFYEAASKIEDASRLRKIADKLDPPPVQPKRRELPIARQPPKKK
jgi:tetratricopeptide (TPR) repeat protein